MSHLPPDKMIPPPHSTPNKANEESNENNSGSRSKPPKKPKSAILSCCNLTFRQQAIFAAFGYLINNISICVLYSAAICCTENLVNNFLYNCEYLFGVSHKPMEYYQPYYPALKGWAIVLLIQELIFFSSGIALLLGIIYDKYDVVKSWIIFVGLHNTINIVLHITATFYIEPYLIFIWKIIPYTFIIMMTAYICVSYMQELKHQQWKRDNSIVRDSVKPRDVYGKHVIPTENPEHGQPDLDFDPNNNPSNYIIS